MTRIYRKACYIYGPLLLAAIGGIAIVSGFSGDQKAVAQQTQPNSGAKRTNRGGAKNAQSKQRTKGRKKSAKAPARTRLAIPKPETMLALVRLYLVSLDQAIKANNFYVLHAISAPRLQSRFTANQLAAVYAELAVQRADLAATVIVTPQITESPKILRGNILNIVGYFPTNPKRINFHMQFQPANRQWKLLGMNVTARRVKANVPKAAAPAKPAKKAKQ